VKKQTEEERLLSFFQKLETLMPNPPKDWAKCSKPCRWAKIIEEKKTTNVPRGQ